MARREVTVEFRCPALRASPDMPAGSPVYILIAGRVAWLGKVA